MTEPVAFVPTCLKFGLVWFSSGGYIDEATFIVALLESNRRQHYLSACRDDVSTPASRYIYARTDRQAI